MINKETADTNVEQLEVKPMASFLKNPNNNTKETAIKTAEQKAAQPKAPAKPKVHTQPQPQPQPKPKAQAQPKAQAKPHVKPLPKMQSKPQEKKELLPAKKPNAPFQKRNNPLKKNTILKNDNLSKIPIHIIPLGGLNEIGKNMTAYECQGDIFIVDCGLAFPDADMLGVDLVIPDFNYVEKNIANIKGLVITHGHEDHIGSIPYLLKKFDIPIYASPLALGLIKGKLKEHGLLNKAKLNVVAPRQTVKMGCMTVEFLRVNHSIPDAMALAIHSPAGVIIQTGDFKVDYSPIQGEVI
ncbi:MAG: ribonuclease J, partial [Oscillospiraceae bacterium]